MSNFSVICLNRGLLSINHAWTCARRNAGFQPGQSSGLSMEMRLRLIERKKKKIEKLSKQPLERIPITDYFIRYSWKLNSRKRTVPVSSETVEERILLEKDWSRYIHKDRKEIAWKTKQLMQEQERALEELKKESQALYEEAIKCVSFSEFQLICRGPVQTLPIANYLPPLGSFRQLEPPFSKDDTDIPEVE